MDLVFYVLAGGLLTGALVVFVATWPWVAKSGPQYGSEVATAATATAFSGVLFTILALPLQTANQFAAGYMGELLRRAGLWLTGAWLVVVAAMLFVLSAFQPDRQAAIAAGLLAGSSLGVVWLAARALVLSSDPQEVARRVAAFLRSGMRRGRRQIRRTLGSWVPRELKGSDVQRVLERPEEQAIVAGFLRHYRAGVLGAMTSGQPAAAYLLWEGALASFSDFAKETGGEVGTSEGPTATLFDIADEVVRRCLAVQTDDPSLYCVDSIPRLFDSSVTSPDYGVVRATALSKLSSWVDLAWNDDRTRVPAAALNAIGVIQRQHVKSGAYQDATHALQVLMSIGQRAVRDRRVHISTTAFQQMVLALGAFGAVTDTAQRRYYLREWVETMEDAASLRVAEEREFFRRGTESIFPGTNLWGTGLQTVIVETCRTSSEVSKDMATHLALWFAEALLTFGERRLGAGYLAEEGLSLVYCLTLQQAYAVASGGPPRVKESRLLLDAVLQWAESVQEGADDGALLNEEVAELIWSVVLAAGYSSQSPSLITEASAELLARVEPQLKSGETYDEFVLEFVTGLLIANGRNESEVEALVLPLQERNIFGFGRRFHIEGLGRVPALNRNHAVAQAGIFDVVNRWAVQEFPRFATK